MKILILTNFDVGLYQFRKELIAELLKNHEVFISLPYGKLVDKLQDMGCRFIDTALDRRGINPKTDYQLVKQYKKILGEIKPDFVITYTIKPNIYGGYVCGKSGIPYAVNITGLGTAFQKKGILRSTVTLLYKRALKRAKVVFFENSGNRQVFIDNRIVDPQKTCLLNGAGVNIEWYHFTPYPQNSEPVRFLFVGRIMKEKGVEELFAAMRRLLHDGYHVKLSVVGEFEENYKEIMTEYQNEGWLQYHGYQEDVRPYIEQSHCFVLPSWHEGMANTNLECAAMGRPLITSNIHGCLEAVNDGVSGFLCEKQDVESLYRAMKRFVELPQEKRREMGAAGRALMERSFNRSDIIKTTVERLTLSAG